MSKRLLAQQDALDSDLERISAAIGQAANERTALIKRAAASPRHEQERIAFTVRQLDREQSRRRQTLADLQRQKNLIAERLSHLEAEKADSHRKRLERIVDLDGFVIEAEARAANAEEDRAYLYDVEESLDATAAGISLQDARVDSILEEIHAQEELLEDERSGKIKARLRSAGSNPAPEAARQKTEPESY